MSGRRYERMHPAEMRDAVERCPLAYVPIGPLEFHGEHLPFGVDAFEAHGLCLRAAELTGGVVLPPMYVASGCLDLPFTLSFDPSLVHAWVRATLAELARRSFRAVVVLTGHGPLDLNHLLKRACAEAEAAASGLAAYGLCWLELNAARLTGPERGEPTAVDHAALVETSWMLALEPELVRLDRLVDDPAAEHVGIYGSNPRFTASVDFGEAQIAAAAELLARRASDLVAGQPIDPYDDLRSFVRYAWPERLRLGGRVGAPAELLLTNPGRASRYLSALEVEVAGEELDPADVVLVNRSAGEFGLPARADELAPEHGFYIRRGQTACVSLGPAVVSAGRHHVRLRLGLGGVSTLEIDEEVEFVV